MKRSEIARSTLESIRSSLSKYSMRKPEEQAAKVLPELASDSPEGLEGNEDDRAAEREEGLERLTLNAATGEPEMPEGDGDNPETTDQGPEAQPMRMLDYGMRDIQKALAPGGTRPPAPVHPATTPEPAKRPRGRPRKVL